MPAVPIELSKHDYLKWRAFWVEKSHRRGILRPTIGIHLRYADGYDHMLEACAKQAGAPDAS